MPEGPEIYRVAQKLSKAISGKEIISVEFGLERLKGWEEVLINSQITSVKSQAKAMLISTDSGYTIYSHNQLYGRWDIRRSTTAEKKTNRSLRILIETDSHTARLYSASDIEVLDAVDLASHPFLSKLGPDLLDNDVSDAQLVEHISSGRFDRRALKHLLLDQSFLSGIGNYLRSEILFEANLHPNTRLGKLSQAKKRELALISRKITERALAQNGITIDYEIAENLKLEGLTKRQYRHWVFTRDGNPCRRCGSSIIHTRVGGRRLDFCPSCQPELT